jgi:CBS domain-containing protein
MQVQQLMTRAVKACSLTDYLDHVARVMRDADLGCLPVLDGGLHVAGIITDRDVCLAAYRQAQPLAAIPVTSAMSRAVITCRPDDEIGIAERLLQEHHIRRLPIVDDVHSLLGILSLTDLARRAAADRIETAPAVESNEVVETLARVSTPRPKKHARPTFRNARWGSGGKKREKRVPAGEDTSTEIE